MTQRDLQTDVVIPLAQSLATGVLLGAAAGSASAVFAWGEVWSWALLASTGGSLAAWMIYRPELAARQDSQPLPQDWETLRVEVIASDPQSAYQVGVWADLDLPREAAIRAARCIESGGDFSLSSLAGAGKPLSRAEFELMRDEFIRRGLARWRNESAHAQGCVLSPAGRAVVRRLAEAVPPLA
jgi:hypothetical protein